MSNLKFKVYVSRLLSAFQNNILLCLFFLFILVAFLVPLIPKLNNPSLDLMLKCVMADILFGIVVVLGAITIIKRNAPIFIIPVRGVWAIMIGFALVIPGCALIIVITFKTLEKLFV